MACNNSNEFESFKIDQLEWNKHLPIKVDDSTKYVYFTNEITDPIVYSEVVHKLLTANNDETFVLVINNGGGDVESAIMLVDAIKRSEATTHSFVTGFAASAATILALSADELEIADHTPFMIHNYSGGAVGKGHEMKSRQEFMDRSLNAAFKDFYKGFLSEEEMEEVIEGKDLWLDPVEVRERWKNVKKLRAS